ncbi:hypothetical protein [uncultured Paludibaculum sp.]|uniref:hypothetical protein n=1 Tax=uncultured Paludibaculum sp. TaxID=1765020 RepID=UPI002AABAD25|nr:hypothetical protein [uncultured Paludibaculum sp.]
MVIIERILAAFAAYLACGVIFGLAFVVAGIHHIDPIARGSSIGFRVAVFPGVVAFWPLLLRRWARGVNEPPIERNPHRLGA